MSPKSTPPGDPTTMGNVAERARPSRLSVILRQKYRGT
jgi:hypothetical protein